MLGKVETPIIFLALCYILIITLSLIFVVLLFISTSGILNFVRYQQRLLVTRHCKIYLEQGKQAAYEGCVKRALVYYDKQH